MKRKEEKVPGFDEIIFENRNKEYGAFDLRKRYPAITCFTVLGVAALSFVLVVFLSFTVERESTANTPGGIIIVVEPDISLIDLNKIKPPEPEISKPEAIKQVNLAPEVVEKVDSNDIGMPVTESLDSIKDRPVNEPLVSEKGTDPVIPSEEPIPSVIVEEMPSFPGGIEGLLKLIAKSIRYPEDAAVNGIQGRVTVQFVVSSDGSVKHIVVIGKVHPALDEEAVRVVTTLPKWKPGKQNGIAVPVLYSIPVNFKLQFN